ncbi:hypothetical protein INR49_019039 [Caranx melampygus]|nr:hypothetical protein INR49_019039 [Caranx melampygus]
MFTLRQVLKAPPGPAHQRHGVGQNYNSQNPLGPPAQSQQQGEDGVCEGAVVFVVVSVSGNFGTRLYDAQENKHLSAPHYLSVLLEVKGPDDEASSSEGKFTFTSHEAGVHQICLQSSPMTSEPPSSAGGTLVVHLDVTMGERANNYTQIAATKKLTELQLRTQKNHYRCEVKLEIPSNIG